MVDSECPGCGRDAAWRVGGIVATRGQMMASRGRRGGHDVRVARVHGAGGTVANGRGDGRGGRVIGEWSAIVAVCIVPVRHEGDMRLSGEVGGGRKQLES